MSTSNAASERIVGLYERHAGAWVESRGTGEPGPHERVWLDRVTAGLAAGAAILDVGCGHGRPMGAELLGRGFAVTGVDVAPSAIARAREWLPAGEWLVGDMRALALGRRFDVILAWHSLFHLRHEEQRAMFPRFAAHAAPGARLLFTAGAAHRVAIGEWQGEPLFHASLDPAEYEALLGANGFSAVRREIDAADGEGSSVWLAKATGDESSGESAA